MVEWLSQRVMHKAYSGSGCAKSTGLTFKEQAEQAESERKKEMKIKRKRKGEVKEQQEVLYSKISEAIELLKKAILAEMDELVEKHREKCRKCK